MPAGHRDAPPQDPVDAATAAARRLRELPATERLVERLEQGAWERGPRLTLAAREVLEGVRAALRAGRLDVVPDLEALVAAAEAQLVAATRELAPAYARVVNASGVLLHTGLGRAPLAPAAVDALAAAADGYCVLEVDPATGERRHRESALAADLAALTGAEASTVVNNNAAALLLALRALGHGREVIVSRGELIEIGGGFRLPELMGLSGAKLVEVGTTNRTYAADYEAALNENTGLLLSVHTSNYRVVGFQHAPARAELVALSRKSGVPLLEDVGSGLLAPGSGVTADEPDVTTALADGVDLVCFSGDKLLGGPQAGLLVGRRELVERCRRDALFRALRPDRLGLVALAATLRLHREAPGEVPVTAVLAAAPAARLEQARVLAARLARRFPDAQFVAETSEARVGSGSSPGREIASACVEVRWPDLSAEALSTRLRTGTPPVFTRLWRDHLRLDVLALRPGDEARLEAALSALPAPGDGGARS